MTPLSADHPNAIRIRDAYSKWFEGVASPLARLLADDVVYHLPGKHLGGGDLRGMAEIIHRGGEASRSFDAPAHSEILDVTANEVFGVTLERHRAKRRGHTLDQVVCGVWRLEGDRCVELWAHFEDPAALDTFWS